MRLVAWNANCERYQSRSFSDIRTILAPLHADLLVISGGPQRAEGASWAWPDDAAATRLVVWVRPTWSHQITASDPSVPHSAVVQIRSPLQFSVVALYPETRTDGLTYAKILEGAVRAYDATIRQPRTLLAGDLNSSTRVTKQRTSHPRFVSALAERGVSSLYHRQEDVSHGEEPVGTYRHGTREFHLDYAFLSNELLPSSTLAIPRHHHWRAISDHFPLIVDIPDDILVANEGG